MRNLFQLQSERQRELEATIVGLRMPSSARPSSAVRSLARGAYSAAASAPRTMRQGGGGDAGGMCRAPLLAPAVIGWNVPSSPPKEEAPMVMGERGAVIVPETQVGGSETEEEEEVAGSPSPPKSPNPPVSADRRRTRWQASPRGGLSAVSPSVAARVRAARRSDAAPWAETQAAETQAMCGSAQTPLSLPTLSIPHTTTPIAALT